jgi:type II secretory ATPase GspE/PulE/Tfp pilus assembly ATPase PilB-like protein
MLDMGAEPFLVVSTVNVIVAQRLVRRLTKTREEYKLSAAEQKKLAEHIDLDRVLKELREEKVIGLKDDWSKVTFCRPKESSESKDGYAGRVGIHEVFAMTPAIRDLIMKGETAEAIETQARTEGMLTMAEDGLFLAAQGLTSIEEVLRVTSSE